MRTLSPDRQRHLASLRSPALVLSSAAASGGDQRGDDGTGVGDRSLSRASGNMHPGGRGGKVGGLVGKLDFGTDEAAFASPQRQSPALDPSAVAAGKAGAAAGESSRRARHGTSHGRQ